MSSYSEKVIKDLEPESIKKIRSWNKEFISKFDEDELKTVLRLSESIDRLWKLAADERRKIEEATSEPLSVLDMRRLVRVHINPFVRKMKYIKTF